MRVDQSSYRIPEAARFIAFEGINGCGKTTLMRSLVSDLRAKGHAAVETREPGGTPLGDELRKLLLEWPGEKISERTELLLFAAGRAEHVDKVIRPSIASGSWVLNSSDRRVHTVAFHLAVRCVCTCIQRPVVLSTTSNPLLTGTMMQLR